MKKTYVRQALTGLTLAAAALGTAGSATAAVHPDLAAKHTWTAAYAGPATNCDVKAKDAPKKGLPNGTWVIEVTTARYAGHNSYDVTVRPQRHGREVSCGYVDAGSTVHLKLSGTLNTRRVVFGDTGPIAVTAPGWAAANVLARDISGRTVTARGNSYVVPKKMASAVDSSEQQVKVTVRDKTITAFTDLYAP